MSFKTHYSFNDYIPEAYLEPCQTFAMGGFTNKNSERLKAINYFRKSVPSQTFDRVVNTHCTNSEVFDYGFLQ